jgi:hypothetical protein
MVYGKNKVERRSKDGEVYHTVQLTGDGTHIIPPGGLGAVNITPEGKIVEQTIWVDENEVPIPTIPSMYTHPIILEHTIPISEYFRYEIELEYTFEGEHVELLLKKCKDLLVNKGQLYAFTYAYYETTSKRDAILIPKGDILYVLVGTYRAPELLQSSEILYYDELLDETIQEELMFEVW